RTDPATGIGKLWASLPPGRRRNLADSRYRACGCMPGRGVIARGDRGPATLCPAHDARRRRDRNCSRTPFGDRGVQREPFVPNSVYLNNSTDRLLIITGPNMG